MLDSVKQLFEACQTGDTAKALAMIGLTKDMNVRDANGLPPLYYAARHGYFEIVKALIENGADVNASDEYGVTPLHGVASIKRMNDYSSLPYEKRIMWADKESAIDTINLLLAKGAKPSAKTRDERTPLDFCLNISDDTLRKILQTHLAKSLKTNPHENCRN